MFKAFVFIRKRADLTVEQFRKHYEERHAVLAVEAVPNLKKYVRHYVTPYGNNVYSDDASYDVVTEIWFDDRADFDRGMAYLTAPETAKIIGEDEERVFDRSSIRFMIVEDCESALPNAKAQAN